jgi:hypothetical protein
MSYSRRKFIGGITSAGAGLCLGVFPSFAASDKCSFSAQDDPLLDWSDWEKFRSTVLHPCLTIKQMNLDIVQENIIRYQWAKDYALKVERNCLRYLKNINIGFLENMIQETTPGHPRMTPCPACRDKGKPYYPHGMWTWSITDPDRLKCDVCGTVFPDSRYPEDIIIRTKWGKPQILTYYGGDPFDIFGYRNGRPSFTGNIRSQKVQWIANYCRILAEGYFLTGKTEYALACKSILLRFADCYPYWLIHVGYGEYADLDPRIAARHMNDLPEPEICPPPNKPDRSLWTGFWSAGRSTGTGLESDFVRKVVSAYDLTCSGRDGSGMALYSEEEKKKIERDLLLESTILLVCDKQINNKSVSNRTAAALVGMSTGHPGLVRFGLECFMKTVDGWYLADGATSESAFYGLMTLGGIWDMAQAGNGYSDPAGYRDPSGKRYDRLDLYHDTPYHRVWDALFRGLQGDLHYPPYADSFRSTRLDVSYVELMVANYPDRTDYLSLLKELCGKDLALNSGSPLFFVKKGNIDNDEPVLTLPYDLTKPDRASSFSFYYRKPGLENRKSPVLKLPDWCPPELRIGYIRTGDDGRESLLLMSASHWGNHHDSDSLNIYYWKKGREVLSDLSYLWDHPQKPKNKRTLAHNTVLIDGKDQETRNRGGEILMYRTTDRVKVMEMSSGAYPGASIYRRTSCVIDHGGGRNYVVDFFRVSGGTLQDYVFHCVGSECRTEGIEIKPFTGPALYDFSNIRSGESGVIWRAEWLSGGDMTCVAWSPGQAGEEVYLADGWGQRDWENSDIGATVPYIVRRYNGTGLRTFMTVYEAYEGGKPFVKNVETVDPSGIIAVDTGLGRDYIMSMFDTGSMRLKAGNREESVTGHFAAGSVRNNKIVWRHRFQ